MAGVEHDVVGDVAEASQAVAHLGVIGPGEIGASTPIEEQGVAGDEPAVDQEALAAGGVAGRVHEGDLDVANGDDVTGVVRHQLG